jgi:hypothetical protein
MDEENEHEQDDKDDEQQTLEAHIRLSPIPGLRTEAP